MKIYLLVILLSLSFLSHSQNVLSLENVEGRNEVSMNDVTGKDVEGIYRYYAPGDEKPFSGILFSKYSNGEYSSWQEYVDGVGQGKWINYYENGEFKEIGYYEQNLVEGPIKKFYENGKMKAEGNYKNWRIKIGKWNYFDKNGMLVRSEDYGSKGSIEEVQEYYDRGEIPYTWYSRILTENGFDIK